MNAFKSLWTMIRLLWKTIIGQLALDSLLQIVSEIGSPAADALAAKAKAKAAALELEYPGTNNGEKKKAELFNYLGDVASTMGVTLAASTLNFIIETAVTALKALGAQEIAALAEEAV